MNKAATYMSLVKHHSAIQDKHDDVMLETQQESSRGGCFNPPMKCISSAWTTGGSTHPHVLKETWVDCGFHHRFGWVRNNNNLIKKKLRTITEILHSQLNKMRQHTRKSMKIANIPPKSTSKTTFFGTSSMANLRRSSFNSGCRAQTFGSWLPVSKLQGP